MKTHWILLLFGLLPIVLQAQFTVEPQHETLKAAGVKCVTVFENEPNAAPRKMRTTCFQSAGILQYDSVYKRAQPAKQLRADTVKDDQNRIQSIRYYKRDSLLYTHKFTYNQSDTCYSKRFVLVGKQSRLADSVVRNSNCQIQFKHEIDSGIRLYYSYHPNNQQVLCIRWENNQQQIIHTDTFVYDSIQRLIEIRTTNEQPQQKLVLKDPIPQWV
jgi:hypothetical protein